MFDFKKSDNFDFIIMIEFEVTFDSHILTSANWIRKRFEETGVMDINAEEKRRLLARLIRSHE